MSAYINFCRHHKLKSGWDERTVYIYPFSCRSLTLRHFDTIPYKSFMKELYHIDDIDLCMESDMELGLTLVKKRVSCNSKYDFNKFDEILSYRLNRIKRELGTPKVVVLLNMFEDDVQIKDKKIDEQQTTRLCAWFEDLLNEAKEELNEDYEDEVDENE